jgi:hypothetical protein
MWVCVLVSSIRAKKRNTNRICETLMPVPTHGLYRNWRARRTWPPAAPDSQLIFDGVQISIQCRKKGTTFSGETIPPVRDLMFELRTCSYDADMWAHHLRNTAYFRKNDSEVVGVNQYVKRCCDCGSPVPFSSQVKVQREECIKCHRFGHPLDLLHHLKDRDCANSVSIPIPIVKYNGPPSGVCRNAVRQLDCLPSHTTHAYLPRT